MNGVVIRARLEPGYAALERMLRDFERWSLELQHLSVTASADGAPMELDARLGNAQPQNAATLATRLERHVGVMSVVAVEAGSRAGGDCS